MSGKPPAGTFTVKEIADHLGVHTWQVTYAIKHSELPAEKVAGTGGWGRGGAWRIPATGYLAWLHISREQRQQLRPGQLPVIVRQDDLAEELGRTPERLNRMRAQLGIPGRAFGRGEVILTADAADALRRYDRELKSANPHLYATGQEQA